MYIDKSFRIGRFFPFFFFSTKISDKIKSMQVRLFVGINSIKPLKRMGFLVYKKDGVNHSRFAIEK